MFLLLLKSFDPNKPVMQNVSLFGSNATECHYFLSDCLFYPEAIFKWSRDVTSFSTCKALSNPLILYVSQEKISICVYLFFNLGGKVQKMTGR